MNNTIDYFFATVSPWTYLGHDRFVALAQQHGAQIAVKPMNFGDIFPVSGGLPLSKRAPQRQAYRLVELQRWSQFLGKPINIAPRFFPVNGDLAAYWIIAALETGTPQALALIGAVGRAMWEQQRDISDPATMAAIAGECGLDPAVLRRAGEGTRDRCALRRHDAGGDRPRCLRRPDLRVSGRIVLGTGSTRLPRPQTGKIACFCRLEDFLAGRYRS